MSEDSENIDNEFLAQGIIGNTHCILTKFLILRFSSIGDIVLTTPVIRHLKQQVEGAQVHFATKASFRSVVEHNPYIDRCHFLRRRFFFLYPSA